MKNKRKKKLNFIFFRELCGPLIFKKFLIANAFGSCPTCRRLPRFSTWHACKVCKRKVFGPTGLLVHTYDLFWILDLFCPKYLTPINVYPSLNQYQHDTSFEGRLWLSFPRLLRNDTWVHGHRISYHICVLRKSVRILLFYRILFYRLKKLFYQL